MTILLLTHGGWGMSLLKGVEMIMGSVSFVDECELLATTTLKEYTEQVDSKINEMENVSLILTDMFGGTPNTVGLLMAKKYNIPVICGLNAPLLLNACLQIQNMKSINADDLVKETENTIFSASKKTGLDY